MNRARYFQPLRCSQRGYVRNMMAAVPRVEREKLVKRHRPHFRVAKFARPIRGGERPHKHDPAIVQVFKQCE